MKNKFLLFGVVAFSCLIFSCNRKISIYDAILHPELYEKNSKTSVSDYCFFSNEDEYNKFITDTYNKAERNYDLKKYKGAIFNYKEVLVAFGCKNYYPNFNISLENSLEIYKKRYCSLYNIACCYSLLGNYKEAEEFLIKAIKSGYPYINHIMSDEDLFSFFDKNPEKKQKLIDCFDNGKKKNELLGQEIKLVHGPSSGCSFEFVNENLIIFSPWREGDDKYQHKYYGRYTINNYFVKISFYKEEYCDLSNSEAYYRDILNENYKIVSIDINEDMVFPLCMKEDNLIFSSEM